MYPPKYVSLLCLCNALHQMVILLNLCYSSFQFVIHKYIEKNIEMKMSEIYKGITI